MPYASMDEVNPAIKGIDPSVTLAQANIIASWADEIEDVESPWAVAIANFKKAYVVKDGSWVKRVEEADMEIGEAVTKSVSGKDLPAPSFLVVGDAEEVGTWHLPVKDAAGKPDHRLMGGAFAALTRGYRGQRYAGPNKAAALAKLKALYKAEDMPIPGAAEMATDTLAYVAELLENVKGLLQEAGIAPKVEEDESELETVRLAETYAGTELLTVGIAEADPQGPLTMKIRPIRPGFGNKKDKNYYPAAMLKRDAHKLVGVQMHESNHKNDKSTRTWVAYTTKLLGFEPTGAPILQAVVHDPNFAQRVRNLNAEKDEHGINLLEKLECSILGDGKIKRNQIIEGKKANIVEALTRISSIDWVTKAGAGGKALAIAESDKDGNMEEQKDKVTEQEAPKEETPKEEAAQKEPQGQVLGTTPVLKALLTSSLPQAAQERLAEAEYADEDTLKAAIDAEKAYLEAARPSEGGRPFGMGGSEPKQEEKEKPLAERESGILERYGVQPVGR